MTYRVGSCNNCGACCMIYHVDTGKISLCPHYTWKSNLHCTIYSRRPKKCRDFPLSAGAIEGIQQWCGFRFVNEGGFVQDGYTDLDVIMKPLPVMQECQKQESKPVRKGVKALMRQTTS